MLRSKEFSNPTIHGYFTVNSSGYCSRGGGRDGRREMEEEGERVRREQREERGGDEGEGL